MTEKALANGDAVVATARNPQVILDRFGRIDVLLNNAGYGLMGAVEEATASEVEAVYKTVARAVLPYMRRERSGRILNISSIGGYRGAVGFGVYSSTKFAVEGLSEAMHGELQPLGIHVTVIEPGYFRTDFLDSSSLSVLCGLQTMMQLQGKCAQPPRV